MSCLSLSLPEFYVTGYSNQLDEPFHTHLRKGNGIAKIWLIYRQPMVAWAYNLSKEEINEIVMAADKNAIKATKQKGVQVSVINNYDAMERFIFEEGLRIEKIDFHPAVDLMFVILNTKAVLTQKISSYWLLKAADISSLTQYELIGNGTGVHWPLLDEDLSLKGFLKDQLKKSE